MEVYGVCETEQNDDYLIKRNILLRNYQIRLLEIAKNQNSIIYLPTGAGKTLIAVHVLLSRSNEIKRPLSVGGKRAIFLNPTKLMVLQTANVLKTQTKFKVVHLTGDMNVDLWSENTWLDIFENNHVLVLTGEILRVILQFKYISASQISLLVLDECHHTVHDHPYNLVMKVITEINSIERPLILGLSSILLNFTPQIAQVGQFIQDLENSVNGKVITETQFQKVMRFSANPTDKIYPYKKDLLIDPVTTKILNMYDNLIEILNKIVLQPLNISNIPSNAKRFKSKNKVKRIKNSVIKSKTLFEEFGFFGGSLSALLLIILFEKFRLMSTDPVEIQILVYARTELLKIRCAFQKYIGEEETVTSIIQFSSDKVQQLLNILKEVHEETNGKDIAILIFVQQRVTAVILAFLLKRLSSVGNDFRFIKPEFIVSTSNFSKETMLLENKNDEILNKFASLSINVLVATNLLEEGIDVTSCNVVISFDFPLNYPAYFQSRGRARNKESSYYMFVREDEIEEKKEVVNFYKSIEKEVMKKISEEIDFTADCNMSFDEDEKIRFVTKSRAIAIDGMTAIKIVYRYCSKLPQDKYSLLSPVTWYIQNGDEKKGFLQLPINCPVREIIEGEPKKTVKSAKRSVFLAAIKTLWDSGDLDDEMNRRCSKHIEEDFKYLFPHFKQEKIEKGLPQPGTSKRKQKYKTKFAESLSNCIPRPDAKAYLHVISFTVTFDKPLLERRVVVYETLASSATFALITSKKLCKILRFPVFLDIGQINCDLLVNYDELVLTESELNEIKQCHFALFHKVTKVLKNSQVFDNRNKEHSFFVVPVEKNSINRYVLNWDLIRCDYCQNNVSALVRYNPSSNREIKRSNDSFYNARKNADTSNALVPVDSINGRLLWAIDENFDDDRSPKFVMSETDYRYFVIFPNYRNQEFPQRYIVNKFCVDMSPLSPFPNKKYEDYISYYKGNYMVDITNITQPLLRVSPIYNCSNFNKPSTRNLKKEKFKTYEEHLIPELCDVIPFDRKYFLKALLLPTVLNRICHVYCVEEFRRKLVSETGLGMCDLPEGTDWAPLESVVKLSLNEEDEDGSNSLKAKRSEPTLPLTKLKGETQVNQKVFLDPEKHMYEVGLCDIEFFVSNLKEFENALTEEANIIEIEQQKENEEVLNLIAIRDTPIPPLNCLKTNNSSNSNNPGPELAHFIQACTSKSANDVVDYERLEILGDSFLKFAVTLYLFRNFNDNEGVLTTLKGKIVGNRNLLYCALNKGITDVINLNDFVPLSDWNPPLICIPDRLIEEIITKNLDPAVIYRFDIPLEEQYSGVLSENTFQKNEEVLENYEKCYGFSSNSLLPYKIIADKTVSDCVEAFIGTYLMALGMRGAFTFLAWLEILPLLEDSYSKLMENPYEDSLKPEDKLIVTDLLSQVFYSDLEDTLNYTFKNKALLLEAITHPSYLKNRVTDCYQRLELLGDSVLDFLITSYIYEYCGNLSPGQVTDIRSSLVNNITFACLTVRYELHKYLLFFSSSLSKAIQNFVSFQNTRNHVVDDNVLILLEENDYSLAETQQIPKALGDIFESLAGAIYLDSGNSLETVWRVYYVMMKREIDEFTKTVPKTPVRLLHEICGDKPYFESKAILDGKVMMACTIYYEGEEIKAYGFGSNKKEAKQSAVKVVLNKILALKK